MEESRPEIFEGFEGGRPDKYGFILTNEDSAYDPHSAISLNVTNLEAAHALKLRDEKEILRAAKWRKMLSNWDFTVHSRAEKLKTRVRKGIPDSLRGRLTARFSTLFLW